MSFILSTPRRVSKSLRCWFFVFLLCQWLKINCPPAGQASDYSSLADERWILETLVSWAVSAFSWTSIAKTKESQHACVFDSIAMWTFQPVRLRACLSWHPPPPPFSLSFPFLTKPCGERRTFSCSDWRRELPTNEKPLLLNSSESELWSLSAWPELHQKAELCLRLLETKKYTYRCDFETKGTGVRCACVKVYTAGRAWASVPAKKLAKARR